MTYVTVANSILGADSSGLLINLQLNAVFPPAQAVLYYNYIAIFVIVILAAFASQSNESRYAFTTPLIAALMVFIGWLRAADAATYWASIVMCLLLGALMYINDMNHEKFGMGGVGDKWISAAFLLMCFTASMGFVSSSAFNFFPDQNMGATQDVFCNSTYQCDASNNIVLDASVHSVSGTGGIGLDVVDAITALPALAFSALKLLIVIVGSVLFFAPVMLAAYPALAASPAAVGFLALINLVIWAIYAMGIYRAFVKPMPGGGEI